MARTDQTVQINQSVSNQQATLHLLSPSLVLGQEAGMRVFVENTASRALIGLPGFREVGMYEKHGKLDSVWRDAIIIERLLLANLT